MAYALAVVVYVGTWAAVLLTSLYDGAVLPIVLVVLASVGAGALARAWSVVPLALVVLPLAVMQPCDLECDTSILMWAILVWTPASAALLAVGVGLARGR